MTFAKLLRRLTIGAIDHPAALHGGSCQNRLCPALYMPVLAHGQKLCGTICHPFTNPPYQGKTAISAMLYSARDARGAIHPCEQSVLSIAVVAESLNASKPSISGEQPNKGTPSFRKFRRSSTPRASANVKACRSRHTRSETLAVVTIFRASSTHAPSSFPWKLIDKRVIGTGSVMSSNARTPGLLRLHHGR
jgi:hypothetical protein